MLPLNQKEEKILAYITETIRENGYAPSVRDICAALRISSTSTVHTYLKRLEEKGYLAKENAKSRTLRVEGPTHAVRVPILGNVTAGQPILAAENREGYITFSADGLSCDRSSLFALRVRGTSMIEAGILDGDIVIVTSQTTAENGDIIVALIDDSATVKEFYKEDGHFRLQPRNPTMRPIIVSDLTILGRVVATVRYYH